MFYNVVIQVGQVHMSRVSYVEFQSKSAINRVSGMPFKWSFNPYRGCAHSCVYCYARETHTYLGYDGMADFEQTVLVKVTLHLHISRRAVRRPGDQLNARACHRAQSA